MVPPGHCAVVVASRPDIGAARQYIFEQGRQGNARTFESSNDWFAIVTDMIPNDGSSDAIARMKGSGLLPDDAFCSMGSMQVREIFGREIGRDRIGRLSARDLFGDGSGQTSVRRLGYLLSSCSRSEGFRRRPGSSRIQAR